MAGSRIIRRLVDDEIYSESESMVPRRTYTAPVIPTVPWPMIYPENVRAGSSTMTQGQRVGGPITAIINDTAENSRRRSNDVGSIRGVVENNRGTLREMGCDGPVQNPYARVPAGIFSNILEERDVTVTGNTMEKAQQLHEFDMIMPDWIVAIKTTPVEMCHTLNSNMLYVYGAINGIHYVDWNLTQRMNSTDHSTFIKVFVMAKEPTKNKRALEQLVPTLRRNMLEKCVRLPQVYMKFMDVESLRIAIINGNTNHINEGRIDEIAKRYNVLINHKYVQILERLYEVEEYEQWVAVAQNPPHPMESMILYLDSYCVKDIIAALGMVVPNNQNINTYIQNNLIFYKNIFTRGSIKIICLEILQHMTDNDIFDYFTKLTDVELLQKVMNVYLPYNNRRELVDNMVRGVHTVQFMTPVDRRRSSNTTTIMGAPVSDLSIFMVGYGRPGSYYTYELADLIGAWYRDQETGGMEFRRPDNPDQRFTISEIESLERLLKCYPTNDEIEKLLALIAEGLTDLKDKISHDDEARRQLAGFTSEEKRGVEQFLKHIFYTGMYMRRWRGPGHPFPLAEHETQNRPDPHDTVAKQLGIGIELLKSMRPSVRNFCFHLNICEYTRSGHIDIGNFNFQHEWDQVIIGKQCIRIASARFVGTGFHYLRSLFHHSIADMNIKLLDRIT